MNSRELKFKLKDTTLTSDVNQTLSNLLSQTNKVAKKVTVLENAASGATFFPLEDLTDASISSPQAGQCLIWNGSEWVNGYPSGENVTDCPALPDYAQSSSGLNGYTILLKIPAAKVQALTTTGVKVGLWTSGTTGLVVNSASIGATLPNSTIWTTAPVLITWPAGSFANANTLYLSNVASITN